MNKTSLITSATGIALLLAAAAPALAHEGGDDTSVSTSGSATVTTTGDDHGGLFANLRAAASTTFKAKLEQKQEDHKASTTEKHIQKGEDKAASEIDKRIKSLEQLSERLAHIKLLPADTLATIQASITAEIKQLTDLKAKIAADTATTTIKADAQSVTKANRIFLLVEPKARIAAAASRINAVVTQITTLGGKLQARITAAQTAGVDVTAATAAMTDMNAKLADAKTQADAAVAETASLQVDNGDKTVLAANNAKLKDARTKLDAAEKDLAAARHDAAVIYSIVKGKGGVEGKGEVHATTTASTTESH